MGEDLLGDNKLGYHTEAHVSSSAASLIQSRLQPVPHPHRALYLCSAYTRPGGAGRVRILYHTCCAPAAVERVLKEVVQTRPFVNEVYSAASPRSEAE